MAKRTEAKSKRNAHRLAVEKAAGVRNQALIESFQAVAHRHGLQYIVALAADSGGVHGVVIGPNTWMCDYLRTALDEAFAHFSQASREIMAAALASLQVLRQHPINCGPGRGSLRSRWRAPWRS